MKTSVRQAAWGLDSKILQELGLSCRSCPKILCNHSWAAVQHLWTKNVTQKQAFWVSFQPSCMYYFSWIFLPGTQLIAYSLSWRFAEEVRSTSPHVVFPLFACLLPWRHRRFPVIFACSVLPVLKLNMWSDSRALYGMVHFTEGERDDIKCHNSARFLSPTTRVTADTNLICETSHFLCCYLLEVPNNAQHVMYKLWANAR